MKGRDPKSKVAAARLLFDGLALDMAATLRGVEEASSAWQRVGWRLVPAPSSNTPGSELSNRAYLAGSVLAATLQYMRELERALTQVRAGIPDPAASRADKS